MKKLIATILTGTAIVFGGLTIDALTPTYEISGVAYSKAEYKAKKAELIQKIKSKPTYQEAMEWTSLANRELKACDIKLKDVTQDNIVERLNTELEKCDK